MDALDEMLTSTRDRFERVLIVSEGCDSMDGDGPDLARLVEIKERFGCWLMVDDAHALGVLGRTGKGIFEMAGVDPRGRYLAWAPCRKPWSVAAAMSRAAACWSIISS